MDGQSFSFSTNGNLTVVAPEGEIRVNGVVRLRNAFAELETKSLYIAIDLGRVTFIDSSGIGLLINFSKRLKARGGSLYLFNFDADIGDLLEISSIGEIIPMCTTLADVQRLVPDN